MVKRHFWMPSSTPLSKPANPSYVWLTWQLEMPSGSLTSLIVFPLTRESSVSTCLMYNFGCYFLAKNVSLYKQDVLEANPAVYESSFDIMAVGLVIFGLKYDDWGEAV